MSLFNTMDFTRRQFPGADWVGGEWVENAHGAPVDSSFEGTAQPAPAARLEQLPEGTRLRDVLDLYSGTKLQPQDPDQQVHGDEVQVDNFWYMIFTGDYYEAGLIPHGEYVLIRKKEGGI